MNDICIYHLKLRGQVDEHDLNAISPLQVTVERAGAAGTWLAVHTDQSGLIGLMRHLHGRGLVLLSVLREGYAAMPSEATAGGSGKPV